MPKLFTMKKKDKSNEIPPTVTEKRLKSHKIWLFISFGLIGVADLFALISLIVGGFAFEYFTFPLTLFVLDGILLAAIFLSNFRFRYSIVIPLACFVATVGIVIFAAVWYLFIATQVYMTKLAFGVWCALHILSVGSLILSMRQAAMASAAHRILTVVGMIFLGAFAVFFSVMLAANGFFGQSKGGAYKTRTVVYEYDSENDYYIAAGVLGGRGGYAVIPETFDGIKVGAIDCSLFCDKSLSAVRLECSEDIQFNSKELLVGLNKNISISVDRESVDILRKEFYAEAREVSEPSLSNAYISLVDCIKPVVANNEVYVQISYDRDSLAKAGNLTVSTWIAPKGTVFNLVEHQGDIDYVAHSDYTDEANLVWGYRNGGYVFRAVSAEDGSSVDGATIQKSIVATASFERVYEITVEEDNDDMYTVPQDFRFYTYSDDSTGHRYVTALNAEELLASLPVRTGFDLGWSYSTGSGKQKVTDFVSVLSNGMTIYPEWTLKAPTISSVGAAAGSNTVTYGDELTLTNNTSAPVSGMSLSYEWLAKGSSVSNEREHNISKVLMSHAGEYTLRVTAGNDSITSLTSTAESSFTLTVAKRQLHITWSKPDDLIYSAQNKEVSISPVSADIASGDEVQLALNAQGENTSTDTTYTIKEAKTYRLVASVRGELSDCYSIASTDTSLTVTILPYLVELDWQNTETTYSGSPQSPTAEATGLGDDGALLVTVTGSWTDAGTYTASATVNNTNYTPSNATQRFTISPLNVSVVWQNDSLVYNGRSQHPDATVDGVSGNLALNITGGKVNVNSADETYTATASLQSAADRNNYTLLNESHNFTITKREITLNWQTKTELDYNGYLQSIRIASVDNEVAGEESLILGYIIYEGEGVNVQTYTMKARLPETSNYKLAGGLSEVTQSYTIKAVALNITIDGKSKTYDGNSYDRAGYTYKSAGLVGPDTLSEVVTYEWSGDAVEAINYGNYTIALNETQQGAKYGNYNVRVASGALQILARQAALQWTGGSSFTYNGSAQGFTATSTGFIASDNIQLEYTYSQSGGSALEGAPQNVGSYTVQANFASGVSQTMRSNYTLTNTSKTYNITARSVALVWSSNTFVENGSPQSPTATVEVGGILGGDQVTVQYVYYRGTAATGSPLDGKPSEAGTYTVVASLSGAAAKNYSLTNASKTYTIAEAEDENDVEGYMAQRSLEIILKEAELHDMRQV